MNLTASKITAPSTNVALMRRLNPVLSDPRSSNVNCQVLITESGAKRPLRMYPAARAEPVACTGDQANQLHHTETGAMILLYLTQAIAPYTEVPPALSGNSPAISA